jgi:3-deoxy-manno-octulosonate cytidylyltransferase (CMP-KDO synthetase)
MTNCIAIIPARYDSTRLPAKVLADIDGMTMLERVYRQVQKTNEIDRIIIATDDPRIESHAKGFGAEVEMTFKSHNTGTERCAQVARNFWQGDVILNVQADEPFIDPSVIDLLARKMKEDDWMQISSLKTVIKSEVDWMDENVVKVVCNRVGKALYFSRGTIPFVPSHNDFSADYFKHLGIYGFRNKTLQEIVSLEKSPLEKAELLEQLRWMENGYQIHMFNVTSETISIDSAADLEKAIRYAEKLHN